MPGEYSQQQLQARFEGIVGRFDRIETYLGSLGESAGKAFEPYADSLNIRPRCWRWFGTASDSRPCSDTAS